MREKIHACERKNEMGAKCFEKQVGVPYLLRKRQRMPSEKERDERNALINKKS